MSETIPTPRLLERFWRRLSAKGLAYWATAVCYLIVSIVVGTYFDDFEFLKTAKYSVFQWMAETARQRPEPGDIVVVLIGDDEFYSADLDYGREPINRSYIAKLVDALDAADTRVIALDFRFALRTAGVHGDVGSFNEIPPNERAEDDELMNSILKAARSRPIVLGSSLDLRDVNEVYGVCVGRDKNGVWQNPGSPGFNFREVANNLSCGHINLPRDPQQLPQRLDQDDPTELEPFSFAIAKLLNPKRVAEVPDGVRYVSFIPKALINSSNVVIAAKDVLDNKPSAIQALKHRSVIVGGAWHQRAYMTGEIMNDWHETPVGFMSGAVIHENMVEAIMDRRVYSSTSNLLVEVPIGVVAAVIFALFTNVYSRLLLFIGLSGIVMGVEWLMFQVPGTFVETIGPIFALWLQPLLERGIRLEDRFVWIAHKAMK